MRAGAELVLVHGNDDQWVILWLWSDSLVLETSRDREVYVGAWWFETVIAGTEWDPVLFTKILNDCRPKLQQALDKSSIFLICMQRTEKAF